MQSNHKIEPNYGLFLLFFLQMKGDEENEFATKFNAIFEEECTNDFNMRFQRRSNRNVYYGCKSNTKGISSFGQR